MNRLLSSVMQRSLRSKGFTLIELLVVIAIIGILAVAVLSAINPIEQINKGKDTQMNSDASQLLGAVERYYANQQSYPWAQSNASGSYSPTGAQQDPLQDYVFDSRTGTPAWGWVDNLMAAQEVKDTFANRMKASKSFVILRRGGANSSTFVCYYPISNSQRLTANTYCKTNGALVNAISGSTCATVDGSAPTTPGTNPICVP